MTRSFVDRLVSAKFARHLGPKLKIREHIAPFGTDPPIGHVEADVLAAQRTAGTVRFYRLSHDLTVKNRTASPANKATDIAATEYW